MPVVSRAQCINFINDYTYTLRSKGIDNVFMSLDEIANIMGVKSDSIKKFIVASMHFGLLEHDINNNKYKIVVCLKR